MKNQNITAADWTADPRVEPLLQDLRNNPPRVVWSKVPSRSSLYGRDDVWNYASPSIDALHSIQNEYFKALDAINMELGAEAYVAAAHAFLDGQPSVADLVEAIEAQRVVAA